MFTKYLLPPGILLAGGVSWPEGCPVSDLEITPYLFFSIQTQGENSKIWDVLQHKLYSSLLHGNV